MLSLITLPIMIYTVLFTFVIIFTHAADRNYSRRTVSYTCAAVAVLMLSLFAAFRGENVGKDVLVYAKPTYEGALRYSSLTEMIESMYILDTGYAFLAFISARLFGNFRWLLFFTELMIAGPVMAVLYKNRTKVPMWFGMLVFLTVFYLESFNVMRQMIAAALLLLAFMYYLDGSKVKAVIIALLAGLFHNSAAIGVLLLLVAILYRKIEKKKYRVALITVVCVFSVIFIGAWEPIANAAVNIGILPEKMNRYIKIFNGTYAQYSNSVYFVIGRSSYADVFLRVIVFALVAFFYKHNKMVEQDEQSDEKNSIYQIRETMFFVLMMSTIIYCGAFFIFGTMYGYRVTLYLDMFWIIALPACTAYPQPRRRFGVFPTSAVAVIIVLVGYWFLMYMFFGYHGTLPLTFSF